MVTATSNKPTAGKLLPTTRCTNCQTVFELPAELLESTDTRVRCGECLCIFDAREGLLATESATTTLSAAQNHSATSATSATSETSAKKRKKNKSNRSARTRAAERKKSATDAGESDEASALDVTYSDFDLFSEDADLPALAYLDETRDTPEFDFDAVELGDEETFSDTLFAHDVTINADLPLSETESDSTASEINAEAIAKLQRADVDFAVDKVPEEPLIFKYEDPPVKVEPENSQDNAQSVAEADSEDNVIDSGTDEISIMPSVEAEVSGKPKKSLRGLFVWVFGVALLLGVLAATVVYPRWESLDQSATFRPLKIAVCGWFDCEVNTRVDIDQLKVLKREVFESVGREDALSISISLQNTADFAQRYPVVEARMTNRVGRSVAQRAFKPSDYLSNWARGDVLEAGEIVNIDLVVNDPGTAAEHHVLQLRELRLNCQPIQTPGGGQRWPVDCAEQ